MTLAQSVVFAAWVATCKAALQSQCVGVVEELLAHHANITPRAVVMAARVGHVAVVEAYFACAGSPFAVARCNVSLGCAVCEALQQRECSHCCLCVPWCMRACVGSVTTLACLHCSLVVISRSRLSLTAKVALPSPSCVNQSLVVCLFYCLIAARYSSNKVHTYTHAHTHIHRLSPPT